MKRTLHLMGPYTGQVIAMADADAATGVTDGWARDITALSSPFDASGALPTVKAPNSLRLWLLQLWGVLDDAVAVAVKGVSKANPTVITVAPGDIRTFNNGDKVIFKDTGTALDNAGLLTVANQSIGGNSFTVAIDLTGIPANVTNKGTVTRL